MIFLDGVYRMTNADRATMNNEINRIVAKESQSYTGTVSVWFDSLKGKILYKVNKGMKYESPNPSLKCVGGMTFYKGLRNVIL